MKIEEVVGKATDEEAGFDLDIDYDIDSDFDSDDVDSDDFDVSTNTGLAVGAYSIDGDDFIEYKNIFDLKFDLSDVVKYIKNKYPEDHYRMNGIIIDENEKTSNGYNAMN